MNKNEILTVLRELHNVTGFRVSLHDAEYREIAAFPEEALPFCRAVHKIGDERMKCERCDRDACEMAVSSRKSYIYECRFGLTESVSPLYTFGELTGFLMMGQIAQSDKKAEEAVKIAEKTVGFCDKITASEIPTADGELIRSYATIMEICARYLTLSGAVESQKPSVAARAKKYIHANVGRKILIKDICESVGCSKSTLINTFFREYGMTVNAYVTDAKIKRAQRLLSETDMSLSEISAEVGFSDQAYFSRVFTAAIGTSPSKYKRNSKNQEK